MEFTVVLHRNMDRYWAAEDFPVLRRIQISMDLGPAEVLAERLNEIFRERDCGITVSVREL